MAQQKKVTTIGPGQAQYILDRLLAERRVAPGEIPKYLAQMEAEIGQLEQRLAELRAAAGGDAEGDPRIPIRQASGPSASRDDRPRARRGNRLAGSYMGYMRQVRDARKKEEFKALKSAAGYERAVAALRQYLGK